MAVNLVPGGDVRFVGDLTVEGEIYSGSGNVVTTKEEIAEDIIKAFSVKLEDCPLFMKDDNPIIREMCCARLEGVFNLKGD